MKSDGIPRSAYDYLQDHESRLDRLERQQRTVSNAVIDAALVEGGGNKTYAQATEPTDPNISDLWVDTANGNSFYRFDGLYWNLILSATSTGTLTDAAFAQRLISAHSRTAIADGVVKNYIQSFAQTDPQPGDLWLDTETDTLYRWATPFGQNELVNRHLDPSLESGTDGCGTSADNNFYLVDVDTTVTYSGASSRRSLRTVDKSSATSTICRMRVAPNSPTNPRRVFVTPGETVSAMARVKVSKPATCTLNISFYDSAGAILAGSPVLPSQDAALLVDVDTRWARLYNENVLVPAGASYMGLVVSCVTPTGADVAGGEKVWVDAVTVMSGPEVVAYFDPYVSKLVAWTGAADGSSSVYRPAWINTIGGVPAETKDPPTLDDIAAARVLTTYYETEPPTGTPFVVGDMWVDTDDSDRLYLWNGYNWTPAFGTGVEQVIDQLTSKTTTYYQPDPPDSIYLVEGDLWFDTDNGNKPHRWDGVEWVEFNFSGDAVGGVTPPDAPTSAPTPVVRGGIGSLFISWPDTLAQEATVNVYLSDTTPVDPTDASLAGTVLSSGAGLLTVRTLPNGTLLQPDVTYYVALTVSNLSGVSPISATASGQLALVNSQDLAVDAITVNNLLANDAVISALQVAGLDANVIRTGTLNAERVSIGSNTSGSMVINGNMEDAVTSATGSAVPNSFAGWVLSTVEGAPGGTVAEEATSPISGTRSMTLAVTGVPGLRVIQNRAYPVTAGYRWRVTAQVRANRTIDQSSNGTALAALTMHTSTGVVDPAGAQGALITWTDTSVLQSVASGTVHTLDGYVTIPAGHRRAKISVKAFSALDNQPWSLTVDEVTAFPVEPEFQVVDPTTGGIVASITRTGDITGHDIDYTGTLNITNALMNGEPLEDRLTRTGDGAISWGSVDPTLTGISTETGVLAMDVYMDEARTCTLSLVGSLEATTADARFQIRVRYNYSATTPPTTPTVSSTMLRSLPFSTIGVAGNNATFTPTILTHLEQGYYSFLITAGPISATTLNTVNTWDVFLLDQGPSLAGLNQGYIPGNAAPPGRTFTKLYTAEAAVTWNGGLTQIGGNLDSIAFGNSATSPSAGNRRAAIWFDDAKIQQDLAGAVVKKVELYLYLVSGGANNTVVLGTHGDSTVRTTYTNIAGRSLDEVREGAWSFGSGRWAQLLVSQGWRTGSKCGVILGPGPTASDRYASAAAAVNSTKPPVLRITYQR